MTTRPQRQDNPRIGELEQQIKQLTAELRELVKPTAEEILFAHETMRDYQPDDALHGEANAEYLGLVLDDREYMVEEGEEEEQS